MSNSLDGYGIGSTAGKSDGLDRIRQRARLASEDRAFDRAGTAIEKGVASLTELMENLRIFQAELMLQNEEIQRSEQRAEASALKFQTLFEHAPLPAFVVTDKALLRDANIAAQTTLGLSAARLSSGLFLPLFSPETQAAVLDGIHRAVAQGDAVAADVGFLPRDGEERICDLHVTALPAGADGQRELVCALVDTTDTILQQRTLEEINQRLVASEARFRALVENGSDILATLNEEGNFLYVSPSWTRVLGHPSEKVRGRHFDDFIVPEDCQRFAGYLRRLFEGGPDPAIEFRIACANRDRAWISGRARLAEGTGTGKVVIATWRDVTGRREAQEAIRRSERKLASILRLAPDGFWIVDRDGRFIEVNDAYCRMSGYSRRELLRRTVSDMEVRESVTQVGQQPAVQRAFGAGSDHFESRHRCKDGTVIEVEMTVRYLEEFDYVFCFVRDVTERKRADAALRDRENLFRTLADYAPMGIFRSDVNGAYTYNNPKLEEMSGLSKDACLGFGWLDAIHPEDRERVAKDWQATVSHPRSTAYEAKILRPTGRESWVRVLASPLWAEPGQFCGMIGTVEDVTEQKKAEDESRLNQRRLQGLLDLAQRAAEISESEVFYEALETAVRLTQSERGYLRFIRDDRGDAELCEWSSREFEPAAGFDAAPGSMSEMDLWAESSEFRRTVVHNDFASAPSFRPGQEGRSGVIRHLSVPVMDGEQVRMVIGVINKPVQYHDTDIRLLTLLAGDVLRIVERSRNQEKLRLSAKVFDSSAEGVLMTDAAMKIVAVNRAFSEITGFEEGDLLGLTPEMLKSDCHDDEFYQRIWDSLQQTGSWRGEMMNRRKSGDVYPAWVTISAVQDEQGRLTHYVAVFGDITAIKQSEEKLDFLAHHDPLTSLPNRLRFHSRLETALGRARRQQRRLAVLFLDLDRFKGVNDSLGHPVGDALLQALAREMRAVLRGEDMLARIGGDEFVVLLEDVAGINDVLRVVQRLMGVYSSPISAGSHELYLTVSIGISLFPEDGQQMHELIRNADAAMYVAKAEGRNTYRFYNPQITAQALERLQLETELRKALQGNHLSLHFQPQIDLGNGKLLGAEVLVRWIHKERGPISPYLFIPVAEETGLIAAVGDFVLTNACRQLREWRDSGFDLPGISVNLSVAQMERQDVATQVQNVLKDHGLRGPELELEITESVIMRHTERAIETLNRLRALGVRLAIDDFGSGFSSLNYLKRLPIQKLKIDQSFVSNIGVESNDEAIVRAVVALSANLNLQVIAEGVETEQQAHFLREAGCKEAQGYLFSQGLSAEEFAEKYRTWPLATPRG